MKILNSMMCLSLMVFLMALPQTSQAAPISQEVDAPQGGDVTISVMGKEYTITIPYSNSLMPVTVQIATPDGEVVYSAQVSGAALSVPTSATSRLIHSESIEHRITSDSIEHGIHSESIEHLVMTVSQGSQELTETLLKTKSE